jgi:hypothetical protein
MYPNHEKDVYGWAVHTAQLLREKKMNEVDFDSVIEEIEGMARSDEYELSNRLSLVISHLLKWQFQPNMRGHSWKYTIEEQREQAKIHFRKNPSLKSKMNEILSDAHRVALSKAAKETALDKKTFPAECPYTFEQIMNNEFYPE